MFGRKVTGGACAAALALFAVANVASAEERKFGYSLTITGSTDYLFRGISFNNNAPTANVYQEATYGIAYLGLWTSTINFGDLGPWEQDIYLGIRPVTGPISWDLAAYYYLYGNRANSTKGSNGGPNAGLNPGHGSVFDTSYLEFKIGATTPIKDGFVVGANVWLMPDQGYAATNNISIEGTVAYDLPKYGVFAPQFTALVGWTRSGTNSSLPNGFWLGQQEYTYWNAGVKVNVDKYFMDFRYSDTTINSEFADSRFVFSAGVNLLP